MFIIVVKLNGMELNWIDGKCVMGFHHCFWQFNRVVTNIPAWTFWRNASDLAGAVEQLMAAQNGIIIIKVSWNHPIGHCHPDKRWFIVFIIHPRHRTSWTRNVIKSFSNDHDDDVLRIFKWTRNRLQNVKSLITSKISATNVF